MKDSADNRRAAQTVWGRNDWHHLHDLMTVYGTDQVQHYPAKSSLFTHHTADFLSRKILSALCVTSVLEFKGMKGLDTYEIARHFNRLCKQAITNGQKELVSGKRFANGQPKGADLTHR